MSDPASGAPDEFIGRDALRRHGEQWRRFNEWELERLRAQHLDLSETLAWMSDAWELARERDPSWSSRDTYLPHVHELIRVRDALRRGFSRT